MKFDLGWNSNKTYFDPANTASDMHKLTFWVLHPLATSQGTSYAADVTIWAKFNNLRLIMPRPSTALAEMGVAFGKRKKKDKAKAEAADKSDNNSLVSAISTVDQVIDGGVKVVEKIADIASRLAPILLLLDKPTSVQSTTPTMHFPGRDLPLVSGLDWVGHLSSHPQATAGSGEELGMEQNPSVAYMANLPSILFRNSFTGTVSGILAVIPVTPSFGNWVGGVYVPSWADYTSTLFSFWRGGMKLQLNFCTSQFVSMKVGVSFIRDDSIIYGPTIDPDVFGDTYSKTCDVLGDTTCEFFIPFTDPKGMKPVADANRIFYELSGSVVVPKKLTDHTAPTTCSSIGAAGYIVVHVLNSPVTNDPSISPTIYLDAWASMAEDIQFSQLTDPDTGGRNVTTYLVAAFESQEEHDKNNTNIKPRPQRVAQTQGGILRAQQARKTAAKGKMHGESVETAPLYSFRNSRYAHPAISRRAFEDFSDLALAQGEEGIMHGDAAPVPTTRESFAKPFGELFGFPSLDQGLVQCEENLDWVELGRRYTAIGVPLLVGSARLYPIWSPWGLEIQRTLSALGTDYETDLHNWIAYPFLWFRGSSRYRFTFDPTYAGSTSRLQLQGKGDWATATSDSGLGATNTQTLSGCKWHGVEQPWYNTVPFMKTNAMQPGANSEWNGDPDYSNILAHDQGGYLYRYTSFGDDTIFMQVMSPPCLAAPFPMMDSNSSRRWYCSECSRSFRTMSGLDNHYHACHEQADALKPTQAQTESSPVEETPGRPF
jgi:hypothetical protein